MKSSKTLLAFDIGLKRTGVASGQRLTNTATPCTTLSVKNGRFHWPELDLLLREWQPEMIVIGDPGSHDPHLNKVINRFKSHIQQQHKIPIVAVDERLTSAAANEALAERGLSETRKTELRDQIAACLILESYFHSVANEY